jgi:hypothetical protein
MGCFVILFALIGPRVALFVTWITTNVISRAFEGGWVVPLLGFFLLPWTTLAYAWMWDAGSNGVHGFEWFLVILAFLFDLGSYAGGRAERVARSA